MSVVGPFESQCAGKVRYFSRRSAAGDARRVGSRLYRLDAYRCPHCGFWHVGSRVPKKRLLAEGRAVG